MVSIWWKLIPKLKVYWAGRFSTVLPFLHYVVLMSWATYEVAQFPSSLPFKSHNEEQVLQLHAIYDGPVAHKFFTFSIVIIILLEITAFISSSM